MDDLISRQAAIDAINTWPKFGLDGYGHMVPWNEGLVPYVHLEDVMQAIKNMPPAQPETNMSEFPTSSTLQPTCNQFATDCISRQAAVELVTKYCPDDDGTVQCDGDIRGLLDELENLPSAQPEPCEDAVILDKEEILQAGYAGREVEFYIGGRLFAVREKAQ